MSGPSERNTRVENFRRNDALEELLATLNTLLSPAEEAALRQMHAKGDGHPIVFIMGPHRSGSTLFMQWLAACGICAYPTNLLSRFFEAPVVGALIQLLLTDPRYNFRNEILDFNSGVEFRSENGKTVGALAPNEFWYFWNRFLPFVEIDWLSDEELFRVVDQNTLVNELSALTKVFDKPFALKGMILNYNIPFLNEVFDSALFVQIQRDPVETIASVLDARKRQFGREDNWYSFKIPEYPELKNLNAMEQSTAQVSYINRAVNAGMATLPDSRKLLVNYESFCENPRAIYTRFLCKLGISECDHPYKGPERFDISRRSDHAKREKITQLLSQFDC